MNTRVPSTAATMRKAPSQQRSRAMVDAILEAATRVLCNRGWARFTTNEVATVAGISIGSLYQYFPGKQALAESVRRRHLDAVLVALRIDAVSRSPVTRDQRATQLIDRVVAAHSVDPALHKVLLDEVPIIGRSTDHEFERQYQACYRTIVAMRPGEPDDAIDCAAALILSAALEGAVHAGARAGLLESPAFRHQLHKLVLGYMRSKR